MPYRAILVLLAVLLVSPTAVLAREWDDGGRTPYVAFSGVWFLPNDSDVSGISVPPGLEVSSDGGLGLLVAVGTPILERARVEAEAGWRRNDLDEASAGGLSAPIEGDISSVSFMANAYLDLLPGSRLNPYVGAGMGLARLTADSGGLGADDESDTVFAYQAMAGLASRASERVTVFAGYRYFATADATFDGAEVEYSGHNLELGVRIGF